MVIDGRQDDPADAERRGIHHGHREVPGVEAVAQDQGVAGVVAKVTRNDGLIGDTGLKSKSLPPYLLIQTVEVLCDDVTKLVQHRRDRMITRFVEADQAVKKFPGVARVTDRPHGSHGDVVKV